MRTKNIPQFKSKIKAKSRKQFLLENLDNGRYTKTLRPLKKGKEKLKPYALMSMKEKYLYNDIYKIGYLDIETSSLQGDFGFILSWSLLVKDVKTNKLEMRHDYITKKDYAYAERKGDADFRDERILKSLIEAMADVDLFIGHWFIGKHRHDIPYIRSRCAINHISGFPKHRMVRYGDTQKWGSQIHRLRSFGLATLADAFEIRTQKTPITSKAWKNAIAFASTKDVEYIVDHNDKDVVITQEVHEHLEEQVPIPATYA